MKTPSRTVKKFDPKKSISRARDGKRASRESWKMNIKEGQYTWGNRMERVKVIRKGLPYESIEVISNKANLPVKQLLTSLGIPQTTYNKKKRDQELLSGRDSEMIVLLFELLDFGVEVFNQEVEKFQRWLRKPNLSLGGNHPESFFDSVTGIQEVKNALSRLEYGNMA